MRDDLKRILGVAAVAILPLAACGGDDNDADDGGSTTPADATVTVEALDALAFDEDAYSAPAGTIEIDYENGGALPHTLLIDGVDGFKLSVNGSGDSDTGTIDLEAGEYTIYCDVPGHRDAGMEATLTIE